MNDAKVPRKVFWVVFLCFVVGQADKQVLSLLAIPIMTDLKLSDTQFGLLQGLAFSLFYALAGIPIAKTLDLGNRTKTAAACVAAWSVATLIFGLSRTFPALFISRAGTAIAEAGLPPAAFSIFAESRNAQSIARANAIFMLAPFLGAGLALVGGGVLLRVLSYDEPLGGLASWRVVMIGMGALGLPLALTLGLLVREPERADRDMPSLPSMTIYQVVRTVFPRGGFFRPYYAALTAFSVFIYALVGWYPAFLARQFEVEPSVAGSMTGMAYLTAGVLGTFGTAILAGRQAKLTAQRMASLFGLISTGLVPIAAGLCLAPTIGISISFYAIYACFSAVVISLMILPIQSLLPGRIQARAIALFSLFTTAVGGTLGPLLVGFFSQHSAMGTSGSLAFVCCASLVCAVPLFAICSRRGSSPGSVQI